MQTTLFLKLFLAQFSISCCTLRELANLDFSPTGKTSGLAVSDLDNDGTLEVIVAVLDEPNKILKYDKVTKRYYDVAGLHPKYNITRDERGKTISVCTCDMDGDGKEELYLHNFNDVYPADSDIEVVPDKLFKVTAGKYVDLFSLSEDARSLAPHYGGHSVACIDRTGSGMYDVIVTTFTKDLPNTQDISVTQLLTINTQQLNCRSDTDASNLCQRTLPELDVKHIPVGSTSESPSANFNVTDDLPNTQDISVTQLLTINTQQLNCRSDTDASNLCQRTLPELDVKHIPVGSTSESPSANFNVTDDGKGTYRVFSAHSIDKFSSQSRLAEISEDIGLKMRRDGRGILVGSLFTDNHYSDIFITNDNSYLVGSYVTRHDGRNVLLKNKGDGTFEDVAAKLGVGDVDNNGRGSGMGDFNADGMPDIVFTNWLGPTRVFQQHIMNRTMQFREVRASSFIQPSPTNILLTGDFDNDGQTEVLKASANGDEYFPKYNKIFRVLAQSNSSDTTIGSTTLDTNDKFKNLRIRGIAAADVNNDGVLELFISHDKYHGQTFSIFQNEKNGFNWIRFMPLTKHGSFARGVPLY